MSYRLTLPPCLIELVFLIILSIYFSSLSYRFTLPPWLIDFLFLLVLSITLPHYLNDLLFLIILLIYSSSLQARENAHLSTSEEGAVAWPASKEYSKKRSFSVVVSHFLLQANGGRL